MANPFSAVSSLQPNPKLTENSVPSFSWKQHYENVEIIQSGNRANAAAPNSDKQADSSSTFYEDVLPTITVKPVCDDLYSGSLPITSPIIDSDQMLNVERADREPNESDGVSIGSGDSGRKYKSSSPRELFKSIGETSKLLTESIAERVTYRSKKVANKLDKNFKNSKSSLVSWSSEASSKLKTVSGSINNLTDSKLFLSLTRGKEEKSKLGNEPLEDEESFENEQIVAPENIPSIHFNSPISIGADYQEVLDSSSSDTYDIPKSEELKNFEELQPYTDSMRSNESNRTSPPSACSSLSSSNPQPELLQPLNESALYQMVNKFHASSNARKTNEVTSTVNMPSPLRESDESSIGEENPYEELYISSAVVDNNFPEMLERMKIENDGYAKVESSSTSDSEILENRPTASQRSSSIDQLRNSLKLLPSDLWNFFDDTNQDDDQRNNSSDEDTSWASTSPEPRYVNQDHSYDEHVYDEVPIYDEVDEPYPVTCRQSLAAAQDNELTLIKNRVSSGNYETISYQTSNASPQLPQRSNSQLAATITDRIIEDPPQQNVESEASSEGSPQENETMNSNPIPSAPELDELDMSNETSRSRRIHNKPLDINHNQDYLLPSYAEAVGQLSTVPEPQPGPSNTSKRSVTSKLFKALKRKTSPRPNAANHTVLEMVPKPLLTERLISHQGHVLKFCTGKIVDMFNEWTPRCIELQNMILQMYQDPQKTKLKETFNLKHILSLQSMIQNKFNNQAGVDLYCVEVVLALPKKEGNSIGNQPNASNCENIRTLSQSYTFGVLKRSDRNLWMTKILQSVTDVFPDTCTKEFTRAGWCYMKKSVSSSWSGAWILLVRRKMYFYNYQDQQLEQLDLRKASFIGEIESDATIKNLHTETGPSLFIDCPPYATLYFKMATLKDTQIWKDIIKETAHKNGTNIHSQQLTKNEVPVLIEKCINFIYAHGSMTDEIYQKSGSSSQVGKILQLFKEDAFAVQLTRGKFNEHDVAGALKKFMQDIPGSFFGSFTFNFVSITSLKSIRDKISSYKELLSQLPKIEYQTLKKLIGHLSFIASLEQHNRMGIAFLAMIWGPILMTSYNQGTEAEQYAYAQQTAEVVADLIKLYKHLFPISPEEVKNEQQMLKVLQKYHAVAENLSDVVKHSGDLKVWITIECGSDITRPTTNEDRTQINVTITPNKTASDVCKELASKTPYKWYELTLFEVICDGSLTRLVHYSEKVLEIVLKWTYWDEADSRNNYLTVRPAKTLNDVFRHIQQAPLLSPTTELKFADQQTKTVRSYKLQLIGQEISVLKQLDKQKYEELMTINLGTVHAYLGREAKRDQFSLGWAITLVEHDFKKRTRDAPFIGHILGGTDFNEQILWYSSILHSLHPNDILPSEGLRPATWL